MARPVLHLSCRLASLAILVAVLLLGGCGKNAPARIALVEANPLSSSTYHIEIVGESPSILFAYKTDVLDIDGATQWNGIATVGALGMAFQQECHSVCSGHCQAKLWRGKWVYAPATTPKDQIALWLMECGKGTGSYESRPVSITEALPSWSEDDLPVIRIRLPNAVLDWKALCDANLDSSFGGQEFLTRATEGEVTLYFDNTTKALVCITFRAEYDQTVLKGTILLSTANGQSLSTFPDPTTIERGTLSEEWALVRP